MLNAYASPHNNERNCAESDTTISRSIRSCDPGTPGESIRLAAPHTDFAKVTAARSPLLLCPSPSWLRRCRCRRSHRDRGSDTVVLRPTERFSNLLCGPVFGWVFGDIEVHDAPAVVR